MYRQFEIVWVKYPFSDQPEKGKTRPALVVSNEASNALDSDILVCPLTSTLRGDAFAVRLTDQMLTAPLPLPSEVRCNKVTAVRSSLVLGRISELLPEHYPAVYERIVGAVAPEEMAPVGYTDLTPP